MSLFSDGTRSGIRLSEKPNDGLAWFEGLTMGNGVIDVDIKGRDVMQQSFVGVAFHGLNDSTFDAVYFRPFNFQSTDSVRRIHGVQYISHPTDTWKKLRAEHNGHYEKAVVPAPKADEWFHATIKVNYPHVYVYVNHVKEPSLTIEQRSNRKTGMIGLWVGDRSNGDFANLSITKEKD